MASGGGSSYQIQVSLIEVSWVEMMVAYVVREGLSGGLGRSSGGAKSWCVWCLGCTMWQTSIRKLIFSL